MWSLVGAGMALAFWNIPSGVIMSIDSEAAWLLVFLFGLVFAYHLITSFVLRVRAAFFPWGEERLVRTGVYARVVHPTCVAAVIFGWMLFVIFPDLRVLASIFWMTLVVVFWTRIEESTFYKKKAPEDDGEVG